MRRHLKSTTTALLLLGLQCNTINANASSRICDQLHSVSNTKECSTFSKSFVVKAAKNGYYYLSMWMLPAIHEDGKYSKYTVVLNSDTVGYLSAAKGGWQSALLDGNQRLMFKKGNNVVSIHENDSEIPCIEEIRIAENIKSATFESNSYDEYLQLAENASKRNEIHEQLSNEIATYSDNTSTLLVDRNVPIKYSFFKVCHFQKGQSVTVSAKSIRYPHSVDMIYMGIPTTLPTDNASGNKYLYTEATSDEAQGLNWKRNSTMNKSADYESSFTTKIPFTGLYMVKLRSTQNRILTVGDMTIAYTTKPTTSAFPQYHQDMYENVPIYYSSVEYIVPKNADNYTILTKGKQGDPRDPMLFVEGNDANRVVGFNDDATNDAISAYGLQPKDACIEQIYNIATSDLHITNYTSLNPETTYTVICGMKQDVSDIKDIQMIASRKSTNNTVTTVELIDSTPSENRIEIYNNNGQKVLDTDVNRFKTDSKRLVKGIYIIKSILPNGDFNIQKSIIK